MKKKLMLRLCLIMIALLFFQSCRQDMLPEKETYHNTSAFQLTSKRISLNESKHKAKLLPELQQVETQFKAFSKTNAQGKVISYANGVSIDTDNVTYIENGPNYHTYTFNLTRDNALPTDPVENLVLTPLADGSYKELLVTYNLTPQEKEALMIGASVDTKGKTTITELAKGSYNIGGQLARFNCGYQSTTVWVNCCHGYHNPTNVDDWASCVCPPEGQPHVYTVVSYVCAPVFETIMPTDPGGSSGGGGGGVGGSTTPPCTDCPPETQTPTEPCNGNGVLTGPFDPVLSPGDGGCGGVVTIPTLPVKSNPCNKTKAMLARPNVQQGITNVKAQALQTLSNINAGEIGFKEKKDGTIAPADVNSAHRVIFNDVTDSYGGYHNHTATGTHMLSPPDIDALFGFAAAQSVADGVGNAYLGMIAAEWCNTCPNNVQYIHYVIQFTGTGTELGGYVYTPAQMKQFEKDYRKIIRELTDTNLNGNTYIKNNAGDLNEKGLEKLFFETLKSMNLNGKVNLQRIENGNVNNVTLDSNGMPTGTPCP